MRLAFSIITPILLIACARKNVCSQYGESKKLTFDNKGNIICGKTSVILNGSVRLKDYELNYVFILDTSHLYVTAYDSTGNIVWRAEPEFENVVGENVKGRIDNIYFRRSGQINPYKVLWVRNGRRGGFFDLKSGKFRLMEI